MLVIPSGSPTASGYNLQRSLRFRRSNSSYLSRTPATTTNRRTWVWSAWVKLGDLSQVTVLFYKHGTTDADYFRIGYGIVTANRLYISAFNGATFGVEPKALLRDPSAWYHVVVAVDTTQATASNRCLVYINGVAQTEFSTANYPAQNFDTAINTNAAHEFGRINFANTFDGLLAEVNFIDGQALTPTSFGEIDATTGVWKPKKYTGSYGTNGFYLPFTDNSALTTSSNVGLGKDFSGNGNYWTTNNISITAGATYDSFTDVPTLTSATASNFCTLNPLIGSGSTFANGNLEVTTTSALYGLAVGTIAADSGKYYWEVTPTSLGGGALIGVAKSDLNGTTYVGVTTNSYSYYSLSGEKYTNGVNTAYGASYVANDVIGVALDLSAGTLTFYKNNVSQGVAFSGLSGSFVPAISDGGSGSTVVTFNFGQRPFAYTPPTGFLPLNTFNLPAPTIVQGNKFFDATLYTGNAGTQTIVNAGGFQPDFAWVKSRSVANNNIVVDSVRGATSYMVTNNNGAEGTNAAVVTSLNSNGLTLGSDTTLNTNASTGVAWQWKKGATPGFDIVTYTGNLTARTITHSLGVAPKLVVVKDRTGVNNWLIWHTAIANTEYLSLNLTDAKQTSAGVWNSTSPTSAVFSVGASSGSNNSGDNYVAYLWSEIAGFSKFGSYVGNGSTDGPFAYCGFRPRYVMLKAISGAGGRWMIYDTARSPFNIVAAALDASASLDEAGVSGSDLDITSNGFKFRRVTSNGNTTGETYIFAAFAENPFKHSLAR